MSTTNFAGIRYFRVNSGNQTIAQAAAGNVDNMTDEIYRPSVSNGNITTSDVSATVTGGGGVDFEADVDPQNNLQFAPGNYLFTIDPITGDYNLIGQILSVGSTTSLTLTANALSTVTAQPSATSFKLIGATESIYATVPTVAAGSTRLFPNIALLKTANDLTAFNNSTFWNMFQYSELGLPVTIDGSPVSIPFTIVAQNRFNADGSVNSAIPFASTATFPATIFCLINPNGSGGPPLAPGTTYVWKFEELLPSITVTAGTQGTTVLDLRNAGYTQFVGATTNNPVGGQ